MMNPKVLPLETADDSTITLMWLGAVVPGFCLNRGFGALAVAGQEYTMEAQIWCFSWQDDGPAMVFSC